MVLSAFGNVLLALSALLVLLDSMSRPSISALSSPDKAGASIQILIVGVLHGLVVAAAVGVIAAKGRLDWLSQNRLLAGAGIIILALATRAIATACCVAAVEARRGPPSLKSVLAATGLGIGVALTLYLFLTLNGLLANRPAVHWAMVSIGVAVIVAGLAWWAHSAAAWQQEYAGRVAESRVVEQEKQTAYQQERLAKMEAIPDSAGLGPLLQFLGATEGPAVHRRVLERAATRPVQVAELLEGKHQIEAMEYLRFEGAPVRQEWAASVEVAIRGFADYIRKRAAELREFDHRSDTFSWECRLAADVARRYVAFGVDYKPALREVLAAVDSVSMARMGESGRREIEQFLQEQ